MLRVALFALAALCTPTVAQAEEKLASVDNANGLITIDQGGTLKSFRVKPFTEVTLNGTKTTLDQLRPNMVVSIGLSDGQTLSTLAARGNPPQTAVPSAGLSPKPANQPGTSFFGTSREGAKKLTIKLSVDARETIKISEGRLWIEHDSMKLPQNVSVNGVPWKPTWKGNVSEVFTGFTSPLAPFSTDKVTVQQIHGRGETKVIEPPTSENHQTLSFYIQDHGGGADTYEVRVTW